MRKPNQSLPNSKAALGPAIRRNDKKFDFERYLMLAKNSFRAGRYNLATDYCRQITDTAMRLKLVKPAREAYYIWCLSHLKDGKYGDARKVCFKARSKLGNNPEILYFELLIAALGAETNKVPKIARNFLELYDKVSGREDGTEPRGLSERLREVLMMWGQALEQLGEPAKAIDVYRQYLTHFPEDKAIAERLIELTSISA